LNKLLPKLLPVSPC